MPVPRERPDRPERGASRDRGGRRDEGPDRFEVITAPRGTTRKSRRPTVRRERAERR